MSAELNHPASFRPGESVGRSGGGIATSRPIRWSKGGYFRGNVVKINDEPAATLGSLYLIEEKLRIPKGIWPTDVFLASRLMV